jgi:hypothetical protein
MESEDESEWREEDSNWRDEDDEHLGEDPREDLEAMIEQADRPFAGVSFGTTAEEQKEGESLDEHLREEQPSKPPLDRELAIEDFDDKEDELVATASIEHDPFVSPEDAAMTVRDRVPGAVDHPVSPAPSGISWSRPTPRTPPSRTGGSSNEGLSFGGDQHLARFSPDRHGNP